MHTTKAEMKLYEVKVYGIYIYILGLIFRSCLSSLAKFE